MLQPARPNHVTNGFWRTARAVYLLATTQLGLHRLLATNSPVFGVDAPSRRFPTGTKTCTRHHSVAFRRLAAQYREFRLSFILLPFQQMKGSTHNHAAVPPLRNGQGNKSRRSRTTLGLEHSAHVTHCSRLARSVGSTDGEGIKGGS